MKMSVLAVNIAESIINNVVKNIIDWKKVANRVDSYGKLYKRYCGRNWIECKPNNF